MPNRIDALGKRPERLEAFYGGLLDEEPDAELQRLVEEAAKSLGAPIALVSLVLARVQYFRAHTGLPHDLAVARATDRDASFCQFVVRDGAPFEVTHAAADERVPQELVERYGIQAYLGIPLAVGGHVVGSLCVIDVDQRSFTPAQRESLAQLAKSVESRLKKLNRAPADKRHQLLDRAVNPAFAEIRNVLGSFGPNVAVARVAVTEMGALARIAEYFPRDTVPAVDSLGGALKALDDLRGCLADLHEGYRRLCRGLEAVESVIRVSDDACPLSEVVESANVLAHHHTKLVGGLTWKPLGPGLQLRAARPVAVAAITSCIIGVAGALLELRLSPGILAAWVARADSVELRVNAEGVNAAQIAAAAKPIAALLREEPNIQFATDGDALVLTLALHK